MGTYLSQSSKFNGRKVYLNKNSARYLWWTELDDNTPGDGLEGAHWMVSKKTI